MIVSVYCPNPRCPAHGDLRSIRLDEPTPGIVALPSLLCARCGSICPIQRAAAEDRG